MTARCRAAAYAADYRAGTPRACVVCKGTYAPGTYGSHKDSHPADLYRRRAVLGRRGPRNSERSLAITVAIRAGASGAAVSRVLGISRERVRQVWQRETGQPLPRHNGRMTRHREVDR
jgi:hypothetical protein